ncbi:Deoxyuridine 5'-triphosphate nucleotidohydrolase [Liberibacter crescens BT-1]|uniref:Deoxyuridine 5'-triphosphate nucleotidohydrolase n=1 Tax=Liberibacter crescens (strain BT-1) TaxID=1215343 RepID=L0EUB9_LIBCB|nr:dUTP diphosphatase [Liberibacter crescens]AGA64537.1 Deoxyuridine 5'-triphosphate nucleotidohydrolase [Liberibacter crescens BT-1]AMC12687.1 deoxyuridine 5'-triphosphate nucleotidohydrolase [Liberibacter crescens]
MIKIPLEIVCLPHAEGLPLPSYQTEGAAGMDLRAALSQNENLKIIPGQRVLVPAGIIVAIPSDYEGQIRPRSGLALQYGITCLNSPGTIDSDYRGELKVLLINLGSDVFIVKRGMRIAQMVIASCVRVEITAVPVLQITHRNDSGFGSTGTL